VTNAISTRRRQRVNCGDAAIERRIVITVRDTGIGISATISRVFDRLARRSVLHARGQGRGSGCPISRWIVQAHGSTITRTEVRARELFTVALPTVPAPETHVHRPRDKVPDGG
jgi:K+-sensing histidine kinase KdpD